jgi:D-glycero-alpha-D-manno-heptose-7-phosphate kinase
MYITLKKPFADDLIRIKYSKSETVSKINDIQHEIAKACLIKTGFNKGIEIASLADIPSGTGLGSSSTYTVGLLSALHTIKRDFISLKDLAEEACEVEIDILKKPMGKQDQYLATFGGFLIMDIAQNGNVKISNANISSSTIDGLKQNLLIFYTGKQRQNSQILGEQDTATKKNEKDVLESLHYIKESGYKILDIVESGNITELGIMFDEHWKYKKKLAKGITNPTFDKIYEVAKNNGAIGGKLSGAGGGGFFTFYSEDKQTQLRAAMKKMGLRELRYDFDFEGTKVLANFLDYRSNKYNSK